MSKITTTIHNREIDQLIPYKNNPKTHPPEQISQIASSINEWGFTMPLLIDSENNVLAGHGRLLAAQSISMKKVPCIVAEGWTEEQKKAYIIADNKLAENGEWNSDLYFSELRELNKKGFNLELIGFDEDFSFDFEPNLNPMTSFSEVVAEDIQKAESEIDKNSEKFRADRAGKGTEVMCPYCAETFIFDGN